MLALSTPTAKKAKLFPASPSFTRTAACCHSSVGAPSVMRKTQGR